MQASGPQGTEFPRRQPSLVASEVGGLPASLSLVLLVGGDRAALERSLDTALGALAQITADYELLVVPNASNESLLSAARGIAQRNPRVHVLSPAAGFENGARLRAGFQAATKEYVAFADTDTQVDLSEIVRLASFSTHYDLVCGRSVDRLGNWLTRVLCGAQNMLSSALLGVRPSDGYCRFAILRRGTLDRFALQSRGLFIHTELLAKTRRAGMSLVDVDVRPTTQAAAPRGQRATHAVHALVELLRYWWNRVLFPAEDSVCAVESAGPAAVRSWQVWLLTAIAVTLFFTRLTYPLIEPDEARYALISLGMMESGDWVIPAREGSNYLDKPPLLYWLTVVSYRIFGVHDYAARAVTATASLGTWLAVYWLGRRMVGRRGALLGSLMLLLSLGFVVASRFLSMDGLLTVFTTVSILSLYLALEGARLRLSWWLLGAVACALGVMTKGPVAMVLILPPLLAWRWLSGAHATVRLRHWAAFFGVLVGIATPWFVAATIREPGFLKYFFWDHHVMRYTTTFAHAEPWWFYIPVIAAGMFPAAMLLPILGVYVFHRSPALGDCRTRAQGYLLLSSIWTLLFFTISTGKLAPYILPAIPTLCLLLGAMLDRAIFSELPDRFMVLMRRWIPFHGTRVVLIASTILGIVDYLLDGRTTGRWAGSAAVVAGSVVLYWYVSRRAFSRRPIRWFAAAAIPLAVIAIVLLDFYPEIASRRSLAFQVARIRQESTQPMTVVCCGRYEDGLHFYNPDSPIQVYAAPDADRVVEVLQTTPHVILVSDVAFAQTLRGRLPAHVTLAEYPRSGGKVHLSTLAPAPAAESDPQTIGSRPSAPAR